MTDTLLPKQALFLKLKELPNTKWDKALTDPDILAALDALILNVDPTISSSNRDKPPPILVLLLFPAAPVPRIDSVEPKTALSKMDSFPLILCLDPRTERDEPMVHMSSNDALWLARILLLMERHEPRVTL
jgi:hypothetical protein